MAFRNDIDVDFELSPRLASVAAPSEELNVQDSHDTLTDIQDSIEGSEFPDLVSTAGGETLDALTSVGLTTTLDNVQYAFDATSPRSVGTATATDALGITLTDGAATFIADGVVRGDWVINFTDQSVSEVLSVPLETVLVTRGLRDGTINQFTSGDAYKVWEVSEVSLEGGNFVAIDDLDAEINPLFTTFGRFATRTAAASATLQNVDDITVIRRLLQNRVETDPDTGIMTIYADDKVTPLFTGKISEDIAGLIPYSSTSTRIDRRDPLV